jgi:hypothetical protein
MPPFVIAPIERARGWRLYLWPFQSSKALVATLCVLTVMSVLWVLVAILWLNLGALALTLTGCLIGSMYFGPCHLLPARMTITTRSDAHPCFDRARTISQQRLRQKGGRTPPPPLNTLSP